MVADRADDPWAALGEQFVDGHYGSLRGRIRTYVIEQHLRAHLGSPPLRVVDVGGGAGNQSIPLAAAGYDVTILDPSPSMLERARRAASASGVAERVRLVESTGEEAPEAVDGARFGAVLCHGVIMYVDDPAPLVGALCALTEPGGIVSIVAKNRDCMAVRPALRGDWAAAVAAFDADRQINGLGVDTRGDRVDDLAAMLAIGDVDPVAWYGVRLFTDGWTPDRPSADPDHLVLEVELTASRRDPYRQLSRLFHLVGRRRA